MTPRSTRAWRSSSATCPRAEVQADWHQFTGYLPITTAAAELTEAQGFYDANPGTDVAIVQMTAKAPTQNSKGLRFGSFVQIRDIINEELEVDLGRRQVCTGRTRRGGLARQRAAAQVRSGEQLRRTGASRGRLTRPGSCGPVRRFRDIGFGTCGSTVTHRRTLGKTRHILPRRGWPCCWSPRRSSSRSYSSSGRPARPSTSRCCWRTRSGSAASSSGSTTSPACSPDSIYLASFGRTIGFSAATAALSLCVALLLAAMAGPDHQGGHDLPHARHLALRHRSCGGGRAVVLHVQPVDRDSRLLPEGPRLRLEPLPRRRRRDDPHHPRRLVETGELQFPVLPRRAPGHPPLADRGRGHRRSRPVQAVPDHRVPASVSNHLLPAGGQHRLRVLRHVRNRCMRPPAADRPRQPPSSSTRYSTTASSDWTSEAPPPSRSC